MSRNPKLFLNKQTYELCFRTEEGLPLVAAPYMKRLLLGYLAAAQTLYPITICHCVFMANHVHLIVVVDNPENVPRFCEYLFLVPAYFFLKHPDPFARLLNTGRVTFVSCVIRARW